MFIRKLGKSLGRSPSTANSLVGGRFHFLKTSSAVGNILFKRQDRLNGPNVSHYCTPPGIKIKVLDSRTLEKSAHNVEEWDVKRFRKEMKTEHFPPMFMDLEVNAQDTELLPTPYIRCYPETQQFFFRLKSIQLLCHSNKCYVYNSQDKVV